VISVCGFFFYIGQQRFLLPRFLAQALGAEEQRLFTSYTYGQDSAIFSF
jgi:hypothetical protein